MDYILGAHIALAGSLTGIMFILTRRAPILLILPKLEGESNKKKRKFLLLKRPCLLIRKTIFSSFDSIKRSLRSKENDKGYLQKDYWKKFLQEFKK